MSAPALAVQVQGQGSVSADNLNTYQQTCTNAPQLRAFVGTVGVQVFIRGIATVNDGGGGTFYWNSTGTGPDDNFTNIVPTGVATGCWTRLTPFVNSSNVRTRQVLTSGTLQSYATPAGCRQLFIRMVGGGGGGGGVGVGTFGNNGSPGIATVFGSVTANPGAGGINFTLSLGGSSGSGSASLRISGGQGGGGNLYAGSNPVQTTITGLSGGNSALGGAGAGESGGGGGAGAANSGGGGGGGCYVDSLGGGNHMVWNGSGAAGEYVELIINSPTTVYTYTIGAGGTGGTGTQGNGGNGGTGVIIVDEFY